jgi:hypothetical protein
MRKGYKLKPNKSERKKRLKLFKVTRTEYSGYDCSGHNVNYLVYAQSIDEARKLKPRTEDTDGYSEYFDKEEVFELPDITRKRKGFVIF